MISLFKIILGSITKSEKLFVLLVSSVVLLMTLLPTLYLYFTAGENFYSGLTYQYSFDKLVYLSQIEESSQGGIITHNLYTSEPQLGYFSPLWLVLGKFSKITTLSSLFTFHFFRIIFGFIFLYLLYLFISQIFTSVTWRKIAFLVLTFSSGLGVFSLRWPLTTSTLAGWRR